MKVLITENKMVNLYQSLIDKCVSELIEVINTFIMPQPFLKRMF